jgi:hypothetical protein
MSMLGLRDISSLSTPPMDRRAVVTEVIPFNRKRIQAAIARELARDGQVFFVHNRVYNIKSVADDIFKLAPDANIVIGHGQMPDRELEDVMLKFMRRETSLFPRRSSNRHRHPHRQHDDHQRRRPLACRTCTSGGAVATSTGLCTCCSRRTVPSAGRRERLAIEGSMLGRRLQDRHATLDPRAGNIPGPSNPAHRRRGYDVLPAVGLASASCGTGGRAQRDEHRDRRDGPIQGVVSPPTARMDAYRLPPRPAPAEPRSSARNSPGALRPHPSGPWELLPLQLAERHRAPMAGRAPSVSATRT